jgi:hypothetical protein
MPDFHRTLIGRAIAGACLMFTIVSRAHAQQPEEVAPNTPQFMPRYDFHVSAAALNTADPRFSWDTHFGGEFDLVDYVYGRMTFIADYQAVLGSEFRAFDPNQGNYSLAASSSVRAGGIEFVGLLHHVSRHLSDRSKRVAIAWNDLDAVVMKHLSINGTSIDLRANGGKIVEHAFVDYSWTGGASVQVSRPVSSHAAVFGRAFGETYGIDPDLSTRPRQNGGRIEGGVRLSGTGGAVELFAGYERVIDADAFDQVPLQWAFAGFRLINK